MQDFMTSLQNGERGERTLDTFFATRYHIAEADRDQQRQGIDRIFTDRTTGVRITVEYKTDYMASRTGNAFVETISVDTEYRLGWAIAAMADWLIYYLPATRTLYRVPMVTIRTNLPCWIAAYPSRTVANDGYATHGLLVPLEVFAQCAEEMIVMV